MRSLTKDGRADLPRFDFTVGRPSKETKELKLAHDSVVIFEGIHALNPVFEQHLPQENIFKVFVNTISPIYEQEGKLMAGGISVWCGGCCGISGSATRRWKIRWICGPR